MDKGVDIHVIQDLLGHRNIAYPRLQIITVEKLLMGIRPNLPPAIDLSEIDRRASRRKFEQAVSKQLGFHFVFANTAAAKTSGGC